MGRLPHRITIKDTLELARSPHTEALRKQLTIWRTKLEGGDFVCLEDVQNEIREAGAALHEVKASKNVGRIVTYLSVPASLLSIYLGELTALGIAVGLIGLLTQVTIDVAEHRLRWAMFGSE